MYAANRGAPSSSRSLGAAQASLAASASTSASRLEVPIAPRSGKYPSRLNLYERPPFEELTLEEFEVWAIDRLRRESFRLLDWPCEGVR